MKSSLTTWTTLFVAATICTTYITLDRNLIDYFQLVSSFIYRTELCEGFPSGLWYEKKCEDSKDGTNQSVAKK